eukprot:2036024-Amphidinium_carterae.1
MERQWLNYPPRLAQCAQSLGNRPAWQLGTQIEVNFIFPRQDQEGHGRYCVGLQGLRLLQLRQNFVLSLQGRAWQCENLHARL